MHQTKYDELTNNLVSAMLGLKLIDFDDQKQDEIVQNCFEAYREYTVDFFTQNYPEIELDKIDNLENTQLISKLHSGQIKTKLDTCYQSFLTELEKSWTL